MDGCLKYLSGTFARRYKYGFGPSVNTPPCLSHLPSLISPLSSLLPLFKRSMTSTMTIVPIKTRASSIVRTLENVFETLRENPKNIRWALLCFKRACSSAQTQLNSFSKCLVNHPERWELLRAVEVYILIFLVMFPLMKTCL